MRIIIYLCLLRLSLLEADAAVVVTYRGGDPNIFPVSSLPSSGSLDINDDGVDDFHFWRDAGFVSGMQGYGTNRIISTLAISPDQGTYVSVFAGDILGSNTTFLSGDWHHHTDNISNPITNSYSSLGRMQSQDAYIGVEFDIDGSAHYGWIQHTGFYVAEFTFFLLMDLSHLSAQIFLADSSIRGDTRQSRVFLSSLVFLNLRLAFSLC